VRDQAAVIEGANDLTGVVDAQKQGLG
jgi:hypothetical protein